MYQVLKEYEKTISELIADKERDKKALEAEVGQATQIMINHFKMGGNLHIFFSGGKKNRKNRKIPVRVCFWSEMLIRW